MTIHKQTDDVMEATSTSFIESMLWIQAENELYVCQSVLVGMIVGENPNKRYLTVLNCEIP